jgi:spore coat protein A
MSKFALLALTLAFVIGAGAPGAAGQTTVSFPADRDNTLYQDAEGDVSNALGPDIFAGRTDQGSIRRAVLRFNPGTIPPGSTVTAVTVRLTLNRARTGTFNVSFHRALADWGEGTSRDTQSTGQGTAATAGDATWLHRFYPNVFWAVAGGDFAATASATTPVGAQNGNFFWSGAGLVADVQAWVDGTAPNYGWVIRGTETQNTTARRFSSREGSSPPLITVTYIPPASPTGACCLPGGTCSVLTQFDCGLQGGAYQGDGTTCTPNPCPQPTGACCLAGAVCVVVTQASCTSQGGVYQGNGAPCSPNPCTPTTTVTFGALKDNTLYQTTSGVLSNGAGQGFFAGTTNDNPPLRRRGVIAFNLASIPSNAIITDVRLRLYLGFTQASAPGPVALHRALADWGEGTSDASGNETSGAMPTTNDATWLHRFFPGQMWASAGGDFASVASASATVGTAAGVFVEWSGPGLVADAQAWVGGAAPNFGWVVVGDEAVARSQRRFDTKESATPANRPLLTVTYALPAPTGACCIGSGACSVLTQAACAGAGGAYQGDGSACTPNPCPQPTGACCLPSGHCVVATAAACAGQGGDYRGDAVACDAVTCPIVLTPYVDELPRPAVAQPASGVPGGAAHYNIAVTEQFQRLHRDLPLTRVWGYAGSFPGPTIEARRGQPVTVTWINDLRVAETGALRTEHVLPVDTCLHGPDMTGSTPVVVTHLHGGHVAPDSDGYPEAAFPPGEQSPVYTYPNNTHAQTIWYHDHALGITRLNVYMGLAGFYLIRDDAEDALDLPRGVYEVPIAVQDRSFHPDGSLKYHEMWMEHFFGDFFVVNGKVWPYLNVDRGKYRFRVVNGCTSRTLTMALSDGATFWQIGTDNGLLGAPVALTSVTIQPGERADLVVDFAPYAPGTEILLTNSAPSPFPTGGAGPDIPNIMKFVVGAAPGHVAALPTVLAPVALIPESESVGERRFELRRVADDHCPHNAAGRWTINGLGWNEVTEFPVLGTTEVWAWINRSGISHPMHLHLVSFQVLDRQNFTIVDGEVVPVGPRMPPAPNEAGWKDTVQATPGQITRIITRFETYAGLYPYHCHILEHEDHEMMRQFRTVCRVDRNANGVIEPSDIASFVNAWYASLQQGTLEGDFGGDGAVTPLDVAQFVNEWSVALAAGNC